MIDRDSYVAEVIKEAGKLGYRIEISARNFQPQINFGHKKLHAMHLKAMYPEIISSDASVGSIIDKVAPGRPCTHKPMRKIMATLRAEAKLD